MFFLFITFSSQFEKQGFLGGSVVKNLPANAGDMSLIPELGRSTGVENGNSHQYSYLENPMDRGAWRAIVLRVTESRTLLQATEQAGIVEFMLCLYRD